MGYWSDAVSAKGLLCHRASSSLGRSWIYKAQNKGWECRRPLSPAAALNCKTWNGGLENQNIITVYIDTPVVLICCMVRLLCHILDLIWSSLWLNRKFSWEPNNFSLPLTPPVTASLSLILLNFYMNTCPLEIGWCPSRQFTFILECLAISGLRKL